MLDDTLSPEASRIHSALAHPECERMQGLAEIMADLRQCIATQRTLLDRTLARANAT